MSFPYPYGNVASKLDRKVNFLLIRRPYVQTHTLISFETIEIDAMVLQIIFYLWKYYKNYSGSTLFWELYMTKEVDMK